MIKSQKVGAWYNIGGRCMQLKGVSHYKGDYVHYIFSSETYGIALCYGLINKLFPEWQETKELTLIEAFRVAAEKWEVIASGRRDVNAANLDKAEAEKFGLSSFRMGCSLCEYFNNKRNGNCANCKKYCRLLAPSDNGMCYEAWDAHRDGGAVLLSAEFRRVYEHLINERESYKGTAKELFDLWSKEIPDSLPPG